jgi:hypothetical protein
MNNDVSSYSLIFNFFEEPIHGLSEAEVDSNTGISVREAANALLNAVAKRVVQEKLVNV